MLQYNFSKIFRLKGIDKSTYFLRKQGFSKNLASRIATDKVKMLSLAQIEKLCTLLGCTPHDTMVWIPEKEDTSTEKHPLSALRKEPQESEDILSRLHKMPLKQLKEIRAIIEQSTQKI